MTYRAPGMEAAEHPHYAELQARAIGRQAHVRVVHAAIGESGNSSVERRF